MKHLRTSLIAIALCGGLAATGCGDDDGEVMPGVDGGMRVDGGGEPDAGPEVDSGPVVDSGPPSCPAIAERTVVSVTGEIDADTTWTCDNLYHLDSAVYVTAVLTIEEGVVVQGTGGANALIITTMGRLEATGTAAEPIVFTSANAEGDRAPGDWGGVVLLGRAPINVAAGTNNIEGLDPGEDRGTYGGTDAAHDCGTLQYARIEFAGFTFGTDNELNGLTLGGCGSATTLDHIQVHAGLDDGIEFFGGSANLSYAVVTHVGDDSLDTDQGYQGRVQFFIAQQAPTAGDRGFEMDNLEADFDADPRSKPVVWNATLVGGGASGQHGTRLRHGTAGDFGNIIVTNFDMGDCFGIQHDETGAQVTAGELTITNSITFECTTPFNYRDMTPAPAVDFASATYENQVGTDPMLTDPTNLDAPDFSPAAGNDLTTGAGTPPDGLDVTATFIGAIDPASEDWTAGWTAYPVD